MKQTESFFKKKRIYATWVCIAVIGILAILIDVGWISFVLNTGKLSFECLLTNIVFLVIFSTLAVLFWKSFKKVVEIDELGNEFIRKKNWEEFQYELYKEERIEKQKYDTIRSIIEKLDDKNIKEDHALKEEINNLRTDFEEFKKLKDKQLIVEITGGLKSIKSK